MSISISRRQHIAYRPRSRHRLLVALLVTALFHFFLFKGIHLKTLNPVKLPAPRQECVMISAAQPSYDWEPALYEWLLIGDPTVLTLPNLQLGFSQFRDDQPPDFFSPVPAYQVPAALASELPTAEISLPVPSVSLSDALSMTWPGPRHNPPPPRMNALPATIIWRMPDGTIIERMPKTTNEEMAVVLAGQPAVTDITRLQIMRHSDLVRVHLLQSCGSPALDRLALVKTGQKVSMFEGLEQSYGRPEASFFFPAPDEPSVLEVEWRLLKTPPQAGKEKAT